MGGIHAKRVLLVPGLCRNLLSVCKLATDYFVVFTPTGCAVLDTSGNLILNATKKGSLVEICDQDFNHHDHDHANVGVCCDNQSCGCHSALTIHTSLCVCDKTESVSAPVVTANTISELCASIDTDMLWADAPEYTPLVQQATTTAALDDFIDTIGDTVALTVENLAMYNMSFPTALTDHVKLPKDPLDQSSTDTSESDVDPSASSKASTDDLSFHTANSSLTSHFIWSPDVMYVCDDDASVVEDHAPRKLFRSLTGKLNFNLESYWPRSTTLLVEIRACEDHCAEKHT